MKNLLSGIFVLMTVIVSAQYDHEAVFVDLDGEALRSALVEEYKTTVVLDYGDARDTFFRNIDAVDNVLECVYTGFQITLNPNLDPTEDAFNQGINTEHTYPRSKGATENTPAFSDMHHLFPTRANVNTDRSSYPFQEITDSQTDKWYMDDKVLTSQPSQNIDSYSELLTGTAFEPREQHKGDVARAYFYFYTMYQNQADLEDPEYFEIQRDVMCQWHYEDPVDEKEWIRNEKIAAYQGGKKNPFILDCRLARLYCNEIIGSCLAVSTEDRILTDLDLRPNPVQDELILNIGGEEAESYIIYSSTGKLMDQGGVWKEDDKARITTNSLGKGLYIIHVLNHEGKALGVSKFIKI